MGNGDRAARLMACIGMTSLIGRLIFGFVSDLPLIRKNGNRIILQQVAFFSMGVCTMLMTIAPLVVGYQYQTRLVICSIAGLIFDKVGSYIPAFIAAGIPPIVGSLLMVAIRFLPPPLEDLDKPGEEESSDAEDNLVENGRWKERRREEKVEEEEEERMLGKRSSMTG